MFGLTRAAARIVLGLSLLAASAAPPARAQLTRQGKSTISGYIFGDSRSPLADVHVELMSDVYSTLVRMRTNASGFYTFGRLPDGQYKVRVLAYGTDYEEATRDVSLISTSAVRGAGGIFEQVDFNLRLKPRVAAGPFAGPVGTVYAQEVPAEAKTLYEKGVRHLREKNEKEGFESLKRSLEVFPDYYLALDRLGTEYVVRGYYEAAFVLLTKAVEVNPRGYSSTLGLGLAQYHLKLRGEAVESLRRATTLYNKSVNAHLWLGIALTRVGKQAEAEGALKRANEVSNGKAAAVHWQLAKLYGQQKRYTEAADALELFLKTQRDARDAEKIRGMIAQLRQKTGTR